MGRPNGRQLCYVMQVIRPEAAGGGFDEVGALEKAKDVLRETVQLPLARPDLFTRGSLARPCKGVLLFGPPGKLHRA
jgi:ATP-dependent 26S proteasome regulatory subunit